MLLRVSQIWYEIYVHSIVCNWISDSVFISFNDDDDDDDSNNNNNSNSNNAYNYLKSPGKCLY
jgi:hypothetical protein